MRRDTREQFGDTVESHLEPHNESYNRIYNRGEDIDEAGVLVRHDGEMWLEVWNDGGGEETTDWLFENYPRIGWMGTQGKPEGFYHSPSVSPYLRFDELEEFYVKHPLGVVQNNRY